MFGNDDVSLYTNELQGGGGGGGGGRGGQQLFFTQTYTV